MVDYKEILRLAHEGYSQRQIERSVRSSHHTISNVLEAAKVHGICQPVDETATNEELQSILFPNKYVAENPYLEPDYTYIHRELAKPGITMSLLGREDCERCRSMGKKPYITTQFGDKYRKWARITEATMRIHHKPGDAMKVDWAGNTLPIYDSVTGEISPAYLFIAVLPCSGYAYMEVCSDMKLENWLMCHVHAYEYFGGVTRLLIPDNLKTGVTKNTHYETILNRSYQEMAEYYNTAIVPARVKHPKDKSHAEGTVKLASTWILAALRNERFFILLEAQAAVKNKLEELNLRPFQAKEGIRRTAYMKEEQAFMKSLPTAPYELATWIPNVSVGTDYLVSDGKNKYSVPLNLICEKVDIRLTPNTVEIFYRTNRIASHIRRNTSDHNPIINPDHLTPEHKKYLRYNAENFTQWANTIGENTKKVVTCFLTAVKEAEQGFKACASLTTKLGDHYVLCNSSMLAAAF